MKRRTIYEKEDYRWKFMIIVNNFKSIGIYKLDIIFKMQIEYQIKSILEII